MTLALAFVAGLRTKAATGVPPALALVLALGLALGVPPLPALRRGLRFLELLFFGTLVGLVGA